MTLDMMKANYTREVREYYALIGGLLPPVVYPRLMELRQMFADAGGNLAELPFVRPPNEFTGHIA